MSVVGFYLCIARAFPTMVHLAVSVMIFDDESKGTNESCNFCGQGKGLKITLSLQHLI